MGLLQPHHSLCGYPPASFLCGLPDARCHIPSLLSFLLRPPLDSLETPVQALSLPAPQEYQRWSLVRAVDAPDRAPLLFLGGFLSLDHPFGPFHAIFHLMHAGISPPSGMSASTSWCQRRRQSTLGQLLPLSAPSSVYGQLWCGGLPLDWWFKTQHDGSPESLAQECGNHALPSREDFMEYVTADVRRFLAETFSDEETQRSSASRLLHGDVYDDVHDGHDEDADDPAPDGAVDVRQGTARQPRCGVPRSGRTSTRARYGAGTASLRRSRPRPAAIPGRCSSATPHPDADFASHRGRPGRGRLAHVDRAIASPAKWVESDRPRAGRRRLPSRAEPAAVGTVGQERNERCHRPGGGRRRCASLHWMSRRAACPRCGAATSVPFRGRYEDGLGALLNWLGGRLCSRSRTTRANPPAPLGSPPRRRVPDGQRQDEGQAGLRRRDAAAHAATCRSTASPACR